MPNKYQVKIEDSILPQLYTFDQLIDAGLLDDVDEKIKVRLNGDSTWVTARSFPFSDLESRQPTHSVSINERKRHLHVKGQHLFMLILCINLPIAHQQLTFHNCNKNILQLLKFGIGGHLAYLGFGASLMGYIGHSL